MARLSTLLSSYFLLLNGALFFFMSCEVGPQFQPPETEVPSKWKRAHVQETDQMIVAYWWEIFHDETLKLLIQESFENNHDLKAAIERVLAARALVGVAKADLYPQLNLNPNFENQIFLNRTYNQNLFNIPPFNGQDIFFRQHLQSYNLPLNLSWEIDLWGRLKNIYNSYKYAAQAEFDAFRNLLLLISTDLANFYFQMRTHDRQIDLYLKTIETRKNALALNQARYDAQISDYTPVSQAALDLANVEADYFEAKRLRTLAENAIATLIGIPASNFSLEHNPLENDPPMVPAGIPSDLLIQRPDIAQAEKERASQHALVKSAYASFFPSLNLTGALGFSSPDIRHFLSWKSRLWQIGASSVQTVFDGGRKFSVLDLQWANFKEADQNYQQIVLTAFQEVEDALSDIEFLYKQSEKLTESVKAASTTFSIVSDRYFQGLIFYLAVMDAERDLLNAERNYNATLGMRYTSTIQLIKALGGNWSLPTTSCVKEELK